MAKIIGFNISKILKILFETMKNSGLVAVGHILASKHQKGQTKALRHFCSVLYGDSTLSKILVDKSLCNQLFDKFFLDIRPTVENFSEFLTRILMKQGTYEINFQLKVRCF